MKIQISLHIPAVWSVYVVGMKKLWIFGYQKDLEKNPF